MHTPMKKQQVRADKVFLIRNFLSTEECEFFISQGESLGFGMAPITTAVGPVFYPDIRSNGRVMVDDVGLAVNLFERARPYLPETIGSWQMLGLNERFRLFRYRPGEKFAPHYDGAFQRSQNEMSKLSFMVYLNDGFCGGTTNFYDCPETQIRPVQGTALVFDHRTLHEGAVVQSGQKYVLRTDVMYGRPVDSHSFASFLRHRS